MYQFKAEYQNARVTVKTNAFGKVEVNTSNADANKWAIVPELAFMIEEVGKKIEIVDGNVEAINFVKKEDGHGVGFISFEQKSVNYDDMSLKELREMFPDITANSKKAFIEQL
jgi:hypothetical protein